MTLERFPFWWRRNPATATDDELSTSRDRSSSSLRGKLTLVSGQSVGSTANPKLDAPAKADQYAPPDVRFTHERRRRRPPGLGTLQFSRLIFHSLRQFHQQLGQSWRAAGAGHNSVAVQRLIQTWTWPT